MKKTNSSSKIKIPKRALIALAITSCCFMMSCANNQSTEEGAPLDGSEQTVSDANGSEPKKDDQTANDLSDLDAAAGAPAAGGSTPPPSGDAGAPPPDGAQASAGGSEDLEKAMAGNGQPDGATPPPDGLAANSAPPPDGAGAASPNGALPPDAQASNAPPPDAPPPDSALASNTLPPDAGAPTTIGGELAPPPDSANPVADAAAASAASGQSEHRVAHGPARAPKVKQTPFKKGATTLNRFYFARKGDTAKSISQLIYGTGDRAKELKRWNKGGFPAGKLVYYASPNQPDDTAMKSFYEERNLQPEQYQVRPGDKMTRIASKKLGATGSWKEIAVLNGLAKINAIADGQTLAIYPDLKGGAAAAPVATEAPKQNEPQVAGAGTNPYAQAGQPNQALPQQPNAAANPAHPNEPQAQPMGGTDPAVAQVDPNAGQQAPEQPAFLNKKRKSEGGMNIGKLLQQNAFFIVMGLGISALLMALLAINKRKKAARGEDFNEDGFGATAVKKRR